MLTKSIAYEASAHKKKCSKKAVPTNVLWDTDIEASTEGFSVLKDFQEKTSKWKKNREGNTEYEPIQFFSSLQLNFVAFKKSSNSITVEASSRKFPRWQLVPLFLCETDSDAEKKKKGIEE